MLHHKTFFVFFHTHTQTLCCFIPLQILFRPDGELKIYKNMENIGNIMLSLEEIDIGSPIYLVRTYSSIVI